MYKLYEFSTSGNCYKIRLVMSFLEVAYERVSIDITKGEFHERITEKSQR